MAEHDADAQHPASPIRLQQARQEGDAARSQELAIAVQLVLGSILVYLLIQGLINNLSHLATGFWSGNHVQDCLTIADFHQLFRDHLLALLKLLLPLLGIIFLTACMSHWLQSVATPLFARPLVQPRNLNPAQGLARIFSFRSLSKGFLGIPKVVIVGLVTLTAAWQQRAAIAQLQLTSIDNLATKLTDCLFAIALSTALTLLLLSVAEYLVERHSFHRRHQMTDQQLRDENRMQGPNTQVAHRRQEFYQR